jgi:tetratricopeptide (TPR) repeat protein
VLTDRRMGNSTAHVARKLAIMALSLVMAPPVPAPQAPPAIGEDAWGLVTTPHFTVFGDVPEARLRFVAARLEAFLGALEWLHPGIGPSPRDTRVYVFKDAKSGRPYTPAADGGDHLLRVNQQYDVPNYVMVAAPSDDPPLDVLYHAYAHQFLDDAFPGLPPTVDEGLAEIYTSFRLTREGALIGLANPEHVRWLKEHPALSLVRQFSIGPRSPLPGPGGDRTSFVSGSWALMHYLASGDAERRARLPAFLLALERGVPAGEAAQSAFGRSLEDLQQDIAQYVRSDRFPPVRIGGEGSAPPSIDGSGFHVAPMARDEVLAALGDVLGHAGADRAGDAETLLRESLRLNPGQARAHAAIGYLRYTQGQWAAAVPSLDKAIGIDPDAMSCYLLARTILRLNTAAGTPGTPGPAATTTPVWLARVRDLLSRAIALQPGFAAPYVTLGATHTLPDGDVAAGIAVLDKARQMLPGRTDIAGNLVYLLLRQGDLRRAQGLVDETLVHGGDPEALRTARAAIATFQANAAAKQSMAKQSVPRNEAVPMDPRVEALYRQEAQKIREEIETTTDPAERTRLERALLALEHRPGDSNKAIDVFNEAVDKANKRDYDGAIALLEGLLPKVEDGEIKNQITALLERLRQDAARLRAVQ